MKSFEYMDIGIILLVAGTIVLFIGLKSGIKLRDLFNAEKLMTDNQDQYFKPLNIKIYKITSYIGIMFFLIGVLLLVLDTLN